MGFKIYSMLCSTQHNVQDAIYYAYFAPYSYERHQDLIAKCISHKAVRLEVLGETLDGHDIDLLRIGEKHCSVEPNASLSCCLHHISGPVLDIFCQRRDLLVAFGGYLICDCRSTWQRQKARMDDCSSASW